MISKTLKTAVMIYGPILGFESKGVSTRPLRDAGANSFLCYVIDSNIIKMIGCWHSFEILCYLHVQVEPLMSNFSNIMLACWDYSFLPQQETPCL